MAICNRKWEIGSLIEILIEEAVQADFWTPKVMLVGLDTL